MTPSAAIPSPVTLTAGLLTTGTPAPGLVVTAGDFSLIRTCCSLTWFRR